MAETRRIPIAQPSTGEEEWNAVREPIMSGWLSQGPKVAEFERAFAARHQVERALATTSGTTALHLALAALDLGPGDEVIVPAFTWLATANAALYTGARPVFVDVDPATFNLDVTAVEAALGPATRAIVPVHLFGLCADMDALEALAPGIPLIEDAACAAGASYKGRAAGSLGKAGVFSFHPRKSITTGEGGMLTTDDLALAERVERLRNHGSAPSAEEIESGPKPHLMPEIAELGFNYRMSDLQGALGVVQLAKLDGFIEERRRWAAFYEHELASVSWLRTPVAPEGYGHSWQSYVCMVDEARAPARRNEIMAMLAARGVSTRPGTHAVHMLSLYRERCGFSPDDFPGARDCERGSMAIPLHNRMSAEDFEYVVAQLRSLG